MASRPVIDTIPAGATESALRASRSFYERVRSAATVMHRPVSALTASDDRWRERLGPSSFDAAALARAENAALYADDLGLRAVAGRHYGASSFPTAVLLDVMHAEGRIADDLFEHGTVRLIEWGHDMVRVRAATIVAAFGSAGTSMRTSERVLARLADRRVTATSAAVVAVGALRTLATAGVATTTLDDAAERIAEALMREREPGDVIPIYVSLLREAFRLLPHHHQTVKAAARRALKDKRILRLK